jgi:heat shock protein HslJ
VRASVVAAAILCLVACSTQVGLQAKTWTWVTTVYNNDTAQTPNEADAFTMTFTDEGRVRVTTDCNNMQGSYAVNDHRIEFSQMAATRMYCEGSQEDLFAKMLENVTSYFIDDDGRLILELKYDSGSVIFN